MFAVYMNWCSIIVTLTNLIWNTNAFRTYIFTQEITNSSEESVDNVLDSDKHFLPIVKNRDMWADKSLLIEAIMDEKEKNIFLIKAPQKWFKTTNLKMLHSFFDIKLNAKGERIPLNKTFAYHYFSRGLIHSRRHPKRMLPTPCPLISQRRDIINEALGQHPVIFMDLNLLDFDRNLKYIKTMIANILKAHSYIFNKILFGKDIPVDLKQRSRKINQLFILNELTAKQFTEEDIISGIRDLSEMLHVFHGKKVIILIDNYDSFIKRMYFDPYSPFTKEEFYALQFFKKFALYTFHLNDHLEKAVITTVLPIATVLGIDNTTRLREYDLLDGNDIYMFFSLTMPEVLDIMKIKKIEDTKKDEIVKSHGGYNCPNSPSGQIFHPNTVLPHLLGKKVSHYKITSLYVEFMFKLRKFYDYEKFLTLLATNTTHVINYNHHRKFTQTDYRGMYYYVTAASYDDETFLAYWDRAICFLCALGYFTADNTFGTNGFSGNHTRLKIVNEEMKRDLLHRALNTHF